ncbi:hypothetical protein J25TS5_54320 [Paenibacillus faecis]|nr:hypothetical protein J25TS5_54320 [Paenibacillus faecis]
MNINNGKYLNVTAIAKNSINSFWFFFKKYNTPNNVKKSVNISYCPKINWLKKAMGVETQNKDINIEFFLLTPNVRPILVITTADAA